MLCAMKFIHESNIIHRDLKPSNILVTDDLEVIIADFGLGRSLESQNKKKIER
jgi:mitogen-activated protein kinase 15